MDDPKKAQALTNQFIRLEHDYRREKCPVILEQMEGINEEYAIANGGGDLFSLYQNSQLVRDYRA